MQVIKKNILYLDSFVNYIKNQKRLSVHTVRAYEVDINQLIQYLGNKKEITHLDKYDLNDYVNSISKHCSAKTLSRKVATLKSMFNFLCDEDLISHNLGKSINSPKVEKLLPNHVTIKEMNSFFRDTIRNIDISYRDLLVIDIIYSTGIRVSECVNIRVGDIDLNNNTIKVTGKGSKMRLVIYGEKTKQNLVNYLENIDSNKGSFLFPSNIKNTPPKKKSLSTRTIYNIVKKYIKLVSNNEKLGPHSLRHSFATHLLQSGSDLLAIKDLLGHASLASTQIYTHLDTKRMKEIYNKSHPHAKK